HHISLAHYFKFLIRTDDNGRGFVDPNSKQFWVFQHHAEQAVEPFARDEMMVKNSVRDEAQSPSGFYLVALDGAKPFLLFRDAAFLAGNHFPAHDSRAGAGPREHSAAPKQFVQGANDL